METYPEDEVAGCAADEALQSGNRLKDGDPLRGDLDRRRQACIDAGADERIEWIYFRSPEWTWEALCGRGGMAAPGSGERRAA